MYFYILAPRPADNIIRYEIVTDIFVVYSKNICISGTINGPPPNPTNFNNLTLLAYCY